MKDSSKLISSQILKDIPQFIRMEYPNFVAFIIKYYEYMEKQGAPYHFIANALNFSDVDRTSLEFLEIFGKNFLAPLPDIIYDQNNIATMVKYIEQYYSARGSEKSFQFLFRLFEQKEEDQTELEFYYPSSDMLRVSDGKWVNEKSIKIIDPPEDVVGWEGGQITGQTSGALGIIDEVRVYEYVSGINVAEIFIMEFDVIHTAEKFQCGETVTVIRMDETETTAVLAKVFFQVNITNKGKFYKKNQRIKVTSASGEGARVVVDYVGKGTVDDFEIVYGGIGYRIGERVYTKGDDFGSGAYGTVTAVDGFGAITEVDIIFGGHDYRHNKVVVVDTSEGRDAVLMIVSDDIGMIETVEVRDFGINYDMIDTTLEFNTVMRVYNSDIDIDIGELITGNTSGSTAIVEYWDRQTDTISVEMISGEFEVGEMFVGDRRGGTAEIYEINVAEGELVGGCLCEYNGRYINMDGHISSLKYIQDSYFYQMFSYMIKTDRDKSEWVDYVKHVHPAGTIGFSYRDTVNNYFNESYGGFICPHLDTTEFYKFRWSFEQYHGGHTRPAGNTQIKQYAGIPIDDIDHINNNVDFKTGYAFGSEITIS